MPKIVRGASLDCSLEELETVLGTVCPTEARPVKYPAYTPEELEAFFQLMRS
jgi:hypothetical protein